MINLESLNQTTNTLDTEYIKTSLSSDTMDNLIQKLDSNLVTKAYINNAYVSHNLYKGVIEGNSTKEFNLKIWIDYDTTKEQGASKTYTSKINVIANPDIEVPNTPEIKTTLAGNTLNGNITGLEEIELMNITNITNDETYPFSYNEETGIYTSTNKVDGTTSTITFNVDKNYESVYVCYDVSSEKNYDKGIFYVDGVTKGIVSGTESNCINLGSLTPTNQIKVEYVKDSSRSSENDEVSFSITNAPNKLTGLYCTTSDNICTPNTSLSISNNSVSIAKPTSSGIKKEKVLTALGNIEVNTGGKGLVCTTINAGKIYCSNPIETEVNLHFNQAAKTDEGVYRASDGMYGETSYYWRGAVANNYVKFANFCWRIVRINGDGSIRLIYDGTTCHANGESTADSLI